MQADGPLLLNIGGIAVSFESSDEMTLRTCLFPLLSFRAAWETEARITVSVKRGGNDDSFVPAFGYSGFSFARENGVLFCRSEHEPGTVCAMDGDVRNVRLTVSEGSTTLIALSLLNVAYTSYLAMNDGLFMHGAVVVHNGEGIILTAPSGGGKSTQAQHWVDSFGDMVLNGDKALVRYENGRAYVYGSPWGGSAHIYRPEGVPLKAVVSIRKAGSDSVARLTGPEALAAVSPRVYYPGWDEKLTESNLRTLDRLLTDVPVYRLDATIGVSSAETLRECLFAGK